MSSRPIVRWPNACLRTQAKPVDVIGDDIQVIWNDMIDTMEAMPGLGLAAPQIGIGLALAVVDASDTRGQAIRLANPHVIEAAQETGAYPEGSPCLPGVSAEIVRPAKVRVGFLDASGQEVEQVFEGLWARSVQHQIDHLQGRMYFDHLSRTKRAMLIKRAGKSKP
ncbi:MAG: peptide deformylase [Pseudomonadota bacterium]